MWGSDLKERKHSNNTHNKHTSTSSNEYCSITFAPSHKHTESVSSMQAGEYMPSDTSKSAISSCIQCQT